MRTLEELYTLLHNSFGENIGYTFICMFISSLQHSKKITDEETDLLIKNFLLNRPTATLHKEFYDNELYSATSWNWFGNGKKSHILRVHFLEYLIKNHIT